jgi:hypothetical protein
MVFPQTKVLCFIAMETYKESITIVFRDMVWKVGKLQSGYNELCVYVEPYLTPGTSFVLGL